MLEILGMAGVDQRLSGRVPLVHEGSEISEILRLGHVVRCQICGELQLDESVLSPLQQRRQILVPPRNEK